MGHTIQCHDLLYPVYLIPFADYQVTVFLRGRPIQNLTYSAYGPNNLNKDMQDVWNRTPDNRYHQPTPDGTLLMFKTDEKEPLKAGHMFRRPM